jgi:hypothetical protein
MATTATAYNYAEVLANLVKAYKTTAQLKKHYSNLVNLYGKEEAIRLMKGYRANKESEVEKVADQVREQLTLSDLMKFAFGKLDKGRRQGALAKLCKQGQTERALDWTAFLSRFYPYTLEDGRPARAVWYTKTGTECFKVYEPLSVNVENAVKVLNRALDNLERGAKRVWVSGKPRLTYTEVFAAGVVQSVCDSKIVKEVLKNEQGEVVKSTYKIARGESKEFTEGLMLTADYITVSEFTKSMNKGE